MRLCLEGLVTEFFIQDFPTSRFELNKNTKDVGFEYGYKMLLNNTLQLMLLAVSELCMCVAKCQCIIFYLNTCLLHYLKLYLIIIVRSEMYYHYWNFRAFRQVALASPLEILINLGLLLCRL